MTGGCCRGVDENVRWTSRRMDDSWKGTQFRQTISLRGKNIWFSFSYHLRVFLVCWAYGSGLQYPVEALPALNGAKRHTALQRGLFQHRPPAYNPATVVRSPVEQERWKKTQCGK